MVRNDVALDAVIEEAMQALWEEEGQLSKSPSAREYFLLQPRQRSVKFLLQAFFKLADFEASDCSIQ